MPFKFVQAKESDKEYLLQLRKQTMLEHLEQAGLFLSEEQHSDRLNYKFEHTFLVFSKKELVGAVKYQSTANEVEFIQLQVDPKHQGKGHGSAIIEQVLYDENDKTVKLTVLKRNPAVHLYQRLGFQIVGEDDYEYHMQNKP